MTTPNAIAFGQVIHSAFSPDGPTNIDWREFNQLPGSPGSLANQIYEIDTAEGQPPFGVSSSLDLCLSCSINVNYCSAPLALIHLSSMLQVTVRVHDVDDCRIAIINLRVSSLYLKAVGAERPRANGIRTTNVHDFLTIKLHFVGPRTCIALFLSLSLPFEHLPVNWHSHHWRFDFLFHWSLISPDFSLGLTLLWPFLSSCFIPDVRRISALFIVNTCRTYVLTMTRKPAVT